MAHPNKKTASRHPGLLIAALLAAVVITSLVLAKYQTNLPSAYKQANAAEFVFLTDLSPNTAENPYPVYDGTINFTVRNYDALNTAEKEIAYTVSVTKSPGGSSPEIFIDGEKKADSVLTSAPGEGKIKSSSVVAIPAEDGDYTVTVSAEKPFAKTITLHFQVNTHYADSFYTLTPHKGWMELDLYTGEKTDDDGISVTINYGSYQPDSTLLLTSGWQTADKSGTLTGLSPHSHYPLIFFGTYDDKTPFQLFQNGKLLEKGE